MILAKNWIWKSFFGHLSVWVRKKQGLPIYFWLQRTANSNLFISNIQHIRQNRIDYSRLLAAFGRKRTFLQNHQGQQKKAPKLPFSGPIICTTCILLQSKIVCFCSRPRRQARACACPVYSIQNSETKYFHTRKYCEYELVLRTKEDSMYYVWPNY